MTHGIWDRRRLFKKNRKGGIEGLPLELMIIVIVATLGTAILVGWMGDVEEPKSIGSVSAEPNYINVINAIPSATFSLKITVTDNNGAPINDAVVVISGCGLYNQIKETDYHGVVTFSALPVKLNGATSGYINVHVSANGYGENDSLKVPVIG